MNGNFFSTGRERDRHRNIPSILLTNQSLFFKSFFLQLIKKEERTYQDFSALRKLEQVHYTKKRTQVYLDHIR